MLHGNAQTSPRRLAVLAVLLALASLLHLPAAKADQRDIIGGSVAADGQFPYQVFVSIQTPDGEATCGGSVLSATAVVTASHCFDFFPINRIQVVAGTNSVDSATHQIGPGGIAVDVASIVRHPKWDSVNLVNDVTILRLATALPLSAKIQPVSLATPAVDATLVPPGMVRVSGWGHTVAGNTPQRVPSSTSSTQLKFTDLPVVSQQTCASQWSGQGQQILQSAHLCTGTPNGTSPCHGDSGGPAVLQGGQPVLVGIVSFGLPACDQGLPAVFARVAPYAPFIAPYGTTDGAGGQVTFDPYSGCDRTVAAPAFGGDTVLPIQASQAGPKTITLSGSGLPIPASWSPQAGNPATANLQLSPGIGDWLFSRLAPSVLTTITATSSSGETAQCAISVQVTLF